MEWKGKVKLHLKWICQWGRWRCVLLCFFQWTHIFGDAWDKFGNNCILILCFIHSSAGKPWLPVKVGRNRGMLSEQHSVLWAPSKACAKNHVFHLSEDGSIKNSFSVAQDKDLETIWHARGFVIQYQSCSLSYSLGSTPKSTPKVTYPVTLIYTSYCSSVLLFFIHLRYSWLIALCKT